MSWISRRVRLKQSTWVMLAGLAGLLALDSQLAVAGTFNVNSTADILNPAAGTVTLRSAIQAANSTTGGNTINLTVPGIYRITIPGANTGSNASGAFVVLPGGDLSIINTSGGGVIVDAGGLDRVFDINPGFNPNSPTPAFTVTMQGFTVTNGLAQSAANPDGPQASGGGIRVRGNTSLTLTDMVITANEATADGGGIAMENAASVAWTLTLNNSTISNNSAGDSGGGIDADGSGQIFVNAGSVISGNTALNDGGGIALDAIAAGPVLQTANLSVQGADISFNSSLASTASGGGVANMGNGAVVVSNTSIHDNSAGTGGGFADVNGQGTLAVSNAHFTNNKASVSGGGIAVKSVSTSITSSELDGNSSGGSGGAILAFGTTLLIQSSTLADNTAATSGAGVELQTTGTGLLTSKITNSTIYGNRVVNNAAGNGGGLDGTPAFTGTLNLLGVTIAANLAGSGGGVFWSGTTGGIAVQNTIIAKNTATTATGPDANNPAGSFVDSGGNLIGVSGASSGNTGFTTGTTQTGTTSSPLDPMLGPLENNGGPTQTVALLTGSPAIGKAVASSLTTDQRAVPRPQGPQPDVGAFELNQGPTPTASLSTIILDFGIQGLTESTPLTVTLASTGNAGLVISNAAIAGPNAGDFSFTPPGACTPLPVTLPGGQSCLDTVTFTPSALGLRSATLTFTDNHMNAPNSQQTVTLTGTGAANGPPDFSVSASPSSATITHGASANFTFTVTPINGFNQAVTFACAGLPTLAQCSFAPSSVTPTGAAATTTLTVTTAAGTAGNRAPLLGHQPASLAASLSFAGLFAGLILTAAAKRRKTPWLSGRIAMVGTLCVISGLAACGGGGTTTVTKTVSPGTPPGTSTITVVSQSGGTAHTASVTLTVN